MALGPLGARPSFSYVLGVLPTKTSLLYILLFERSDLVNPNWGWFPPCLNSWVTLGGFRKENLKQSWSISLLVLAIHIGFRSL